MQTFHTVCRIADVLIALQQHGNSNYLGWSLSFPCNISNVVSKLNMQANTMECHLEEWKKQVSDQRDEYYELNYFSTQQLLSLREELGKFKVASEAEVDVSPKVMAMLQSISPEVREENIKKQVLFIDAHIRKQERSSQMGSTVSDKLSQRDVQPLNQTNETKQYVVDEANLATSGHLAVDDHPDLNRQKPSNQSLMTEILATAARTADPTAAPEPKLNMEQLTSSQHSILMNVEQNCDVPRKLILLAFERCERPDVENEIIDWCIEHGDEFQYEDSDTTSQSSGSAGESEDEVEGEVKSM